ncbi:MAG: TlpA family protein disulfide reductase [Planctomycetota bacterium]
MPTPRLAVVRSRLFATLCALAAPLAAQGDWTREAAIAELKELALTKTPMAEWKARDAKIAAWSERVAASKLDLGDHRFLLGVAKYFAKDVDGAGALLLEELSARGGALPTGDFDTIVGRTLMNRVVAGVRAKDYASAQAALPHAMRLYNDPAMVARAVATTTSDDASPAAAALLDDALGRLFADARVTPEARIAAVKAMFTPRQPAAAAADKGGAAALKPFSATDMDGNPVSLAALQGKVVLVDFWATWCGPCLREMPNVVAAHKKHAADGFAVLGISLDGEPGQERGKPVIPPAKDGETAAKIRAKAKELGMAWPQVYEGGGWETRLAKENDIKSIPATYLLDRKGVVRYRNLRGEELGKRVAELLAEKP